MKDQIIKQAIKDEAKRQKEYVELIASENFTSADVMEATGSILTNKYAEGYPGRRYYGGCEFVDVVEQTAIDRLKEMFRCGFANVQPHSGSQANGAVFNALLEPGDKILGMSLNSGGHLTHGYHVNMSGKLYESHNYDVDEKTHEIDFEKVRAKAIEVQPKLIICGASAYPRIVDFKKFREIADEVGALLMADVAHIAGLIVAGLHPNPFDHGVNVVTSTTHKTLRGPRGGIILSDNEDIAKKVDSGIFPGTQGGPLMHVIAGKAIAFGEALTPEFNEYQRNVVANAKTMADTFIKNGVTLTTNGTDNHLMIINTKESFKVTGDRAEKLLEKAHIVVNKNSVPFDEERPTVTSGIRIGTPAMTTKGFQKEDFIKITEIIINVLKNDSEEYAEEASKEVKELLKNIK